MRRVRAPVGACPDRSSELAALLADPPPPDAPLPALLGFAYRARQVTQCGCTQGDDRCTSIQTELLAYRFRLGWLGTLPPVAARAVSREWFGWRAARGGEVVELEAHRTR